MQWPAARRPGVSFPGPQRPAKFKVGLTPTVALPGHAKSAQPRCVSIRGGFRYSIEFRLPLFRAPARISKRIGGEDKCVMRLPSVHRVARDNGRIAHQCTAKTLETAKL